MSATGRHQPLGGAKAASSAAIRPNTSTSDRVSEKLNFSERRRYDSSV
jgi:hypothetical protein